MGKFIIKHIQRCKPQYNGARNGVDDKQEAVKEETIMTTSEKIAMAQSVLNDASTKRIKKDKGLIERTESSKTILTEDNKELLND
jgi:hypothetical protein